MTLGNADRKVHPVALKRCGKCRILRPRSERFFPLQRQANPNWKPSLGSGCRVCGSWCDRLRRARLLAEDPARLRAEEATKRAVRRADPERYAAWLVYNREWLRRRHGYTPRAKDDSMTGVRVSSAPVRAAVEASPLCMNVIARLAGRDPSGMRRSLSGEMMTAECAVAVLGALDLSPAEVGL